MGPIGSGEHAAVDGNKAVVLRLYDDLLNRGRLSMADELFAADFVGHACGPEVVLGPTSARSFAIRLQRAFPGARHIVEALIGEEDMVVARLAISAPSPEPVSGLLPEGTRLAEEQIHILRLTSGKVAELWVAHRCGVADKACGCAFHLIRSPPDRR